MNADKNTISDGHIGLLDGLRGAMAFWVFYGHLKIACLGTPPRFGHPANAVDVFMVLSGFLMTYHWLAREKKFNSHFRQSVDFYTRRFFRIAPLYYLLFTIAFIGQNYFFGVADHGHAVGANLATASDYVSPSKYARTPFNALVHYTFLFGAFPGYVSNNPLPDWSIGLEMQFYMFFPFLLLIVARLGPLTTIGLTVVVTYITNSLFSLYDNPAKVLGNFPQPGFLFFKLDVFMAGICLAFHYREASNRNKIFWLLLGALCLLRTSIQVKGIVFGAMCLIHFDLHRKDLIHRLLTSRLGRFAGDTSYSVYLLHVLILHPILAALLATTWFPRFPKPCQFYLSFVIVAVPLYLLAAVLHRYVEVPGIALGRKFATRINSWIPWPAAATALEPAPVKPAETVDLKS